MSLILCGTMTIPAFAKDTVTVSDTYNSSPSGGNQQHRFITVVKDPAWTKLKKISGQPTKGTYLKKGDMLFYTEGGGKSVSISFGVSLGSTYANASASVSFDVPLGKMNSTQYGKAMRASSPGYYIIKAKKKVQPTIKFIQYRNKQSNGKWGAWGKPSVFSKNYKVIQAYSTLVKQ